MFIMYIGTIPNVEIKFEDGGSAKIKKNEVIELSDYEGAKFVSTQNFVELLPKVEEPKEDKKIKKNTKKEVK